MKLKFVTRLLFFSALLFIFFGGNEVHAVEIGFVSEEGEHFAVGQEFKVQLMIDPQGKEINAISATVVFSEDVVEVKNLRDGSSVVTLWVDDPVVEEGSLSFAGVIPGGFEGARGSFEGVRPGEILSFTVLPIKEGGGKIYLESAEILLHNGEGASVEYTALDLDFTVEGEVAVKSPTAEDVTDSVPEPFRIKRGANPNVFDGKHFIYFNSKDRIAGIGYYAVYESRTPRDPESISENSWTVVKSPYLLKDQKLKSYVYVKAVNREGAYRISELEPKYEAKWYDSPVTKIAFSLFMLLILIGLFFLMKRRGVLGK